MTGAEMAERDRMDVALEGAQEAASVLRQLAEGGDAVPASTATWLAWLLDDYLRTIDEIVNRPTPTA